MTQSKSQEIKITQVRSLIHRPGYQKKTIAALGLHRINHSVVHTATPQILGMANAVKHLVRIEEVK
ncbi:MAG: 50S ribosomal protein L30 [Calditrichales bacterium]|nr:MAG: 50S ribosomal protein L30 [Calditrichales bacterium]